MKEKDLFQRAAGVLAFFEIWNFPLRTEEISALLGEQISTEFLTKQFHFFEDGKIFYFSTITNVTVLQESRREGEIYSEKLKQRAEKYIRVLRYFPYIRGIALTNTPVMNVAKAESDIDLFVVVKKGRIWTARFWTTVFFSILGLRARKEKTRGKFCLSFFVDEEYLNFEPIKKNKDIYLTFWAATMQPFFGRNYFQKMIQENSEWIRGEASIVFQNTKNIPDQGVSGVQRILEFLLPKWTEFIFLKILLSKARKFQDKDSRFYNPDMIFEENIQKLHNPDLRDQIQLQWETNLQRFLETKT